MKDSEFFIDLRIRQNKGFSWINVSVTVSTLQIPPFYNCLCFQPNISIIRMEVEVWNFRHMECMYYFKLCKEQWIEAIPVLLLIKVHCTLASFCQFSFSLTEACKTNTSAKSDILFCSCCRPFYFAYIPIFRCLFITGGASRRRSITNYATEVFETHQGTHILQVNIPHLYMYISE